MGAIPKSEAKSEAFVPFGYAQGDASLLITINFRQPQEGKADMNWKGLRCDRQCWRI